MGRYRNLILLHLIVLIFGFTGILGKLISIGAEPLVFWRCAIASAVLGAYMAARSRLRRYPLSVMLRWAGISGIAAAHWITFFAAIKVSNVSVALATLATSALFVSVTAPLVTKKKYDWRESVLGLLVIVGVSIILSVETRYINGIVLSLISAFLAGLFSTLNSIQIKTYDALNISFYELSAAAVLVAVYLAVTGGWSADVVVLSANDWLWIALLATVATAFAYVVSVDVMKELTPFTVALAINLEPVYSIILALLIFGDEEKMSPGFYWGALLILLALFADAVLKRRKRRAVDLANSAK
ncbi:MAG: DMT family transporter [Flavobacteriales bacterium]